MTRVKRVAENRRARFDIAIKDTLEAGLVLTGDEIKSIRADRVQLQGSYIKLLKGGKEANALPRAVVLGIHLSAAGEPDRTRALLLHSREIRLLEESLNQKGSTAVPLEIILKNGYAKLVIGIGPGRKNYDKRQLLKDRAVTRDQEQALKSRRG